MKSPAIIITIIILAAVAVIVGSISSPRDADTVAQEQEVIMAEQQFTKATMQTSAGTITFELFADKAPNTVANFGKLASEGFYDGVRFHRVIEGFMIQGGDPQSKDEELKDFWGTGGPGYKFDDELPQPGEYELGSLAMANSGPNTNGSQFFIVSGPSGVGLPPLYSLFGKVTEGMDIVEAISQVATDGRDRPIEDVVITDITVE